MDQQINRYFVGIISFAVVATWMSAGLLVASVSLVAALLAMRIVPALMTPASRRRRVDRPESPARRASKRPRKLVSTRPVAEEGEYQLVPDDPSLILSLSD